MLEFHNKLSIMSETTEQDLLNAVKESLQRDGRLGRFKAELRAAVMSILHKRPLNDKDHIEIPEETKLINNLLREYLVWNGYIYSEQILVAESSLEQERPTRECIATKLGVVDDANTTKIPLLYYIVSAFQNHEET
ncbi:hypothetical protein RN001_013796 [Aquatica leii]|uniref:FGFR1 oncogene partner (FOP) N-terminal dimerisation domain-containing protein n=1 Tax=Aquatica leii TaxID=1421715 RepID=A0AAN7P312_9COLE|nr:hypothetical protein RN001_013796 [Aquatica leii]